MIRYLLAFLFCTSLFAVDSQICIAVNIKNNESTIWQCLQSVKEIANCYSICDMGSTDKTRELVEKFLKTTGIPGKIHQREPQSFNQNKIINAQTAQTTLKSLGFSLAATYIVLMDPDQYMTGDASILHTTLEDEAYLVLDKSHALSYFTYNPNFFKASLNADTIGDLSAQGTTKRAHPFRKLRTIKIEDFTVGTYDETEPLEKKQDEFKQEKLKRNVELFTQAIKDDPENRRYHLYLAQSYKSLKQYENAINCYQERINKEGDAEELWLSKYMIGECYDEMGSWAQALYWYLDAYQFNPNRAESIKKITTHYRLYGQNEVAYIFAKHGLRIPYKKDDIFFPMPALYDYNFDEEISIVAYYTRFRDEGYTASNDLLIRKDTPGHIKKQGYRNILFYSNHLKAKYDRIQIPLPFIDGDSDLLYNPMNPSIFKTADGYKLICRAVNYTQTGAKHFHTADPSGIFRTKNFLINYDANFKQLSQNEIIEDLDREKHTSFIVTGLEDCRLFELDGSTYFTCTTFDTSTAGTIQVSLCKLEDKSVPDGLPIRVESLVPLQGPDPHRHEKNWLPYIKDGKLNIVYSSDPFVIYQPDFSTGECATLLKKFPDHDFSWFRGSAAPIEFDNGYLMLVHEVVELDDHSRIYLHRFVYLDKQFTVKSTSRPFTFRHQGVEFCLSMTIDHAGERLIMPIGIEDKEAYLAFVDLNEVRSMLLPLPKIFEPF